MTNPEREPAEIECTAGSQPADVEVLTAREVPLGGQRAMTIRRILPQRQRSLIGAWCFLDHYGPDSVADSGGMRVAPHPHTGLQTVSWMFTGEVEHRDSAGNVAMVRPGEVNLMTGGRGISHSENSTDATEMLHGVQLWVALPDAARFADPGFQHHVPEAVIGDGWRARVFLGSLLDDTSPVHTFTPLLGAEVLLEPGIELSLAIDPAFEHGILVDAGVLEIHRPGDTRGPWVEAGREVKPAELAYLAPGCSAVGMRAGPEPVRALVLGGPPFGESIVMWWNFVGRSHEEIAGFRDDWQTQITRDGVVVGDAQDLAPGRFGVVTGDHDRPIPAPPLPEGRLQQRR